MGIGLLRQDVVQAADALSVALRTVSKALKFEVILVYVEKLFDDSGLGWYSGVIYSRGRDACLSKPPVSDALHY